MLHMLMAIHTPDDCPFAVPAWREKVLPQLKRREEVAKKLGVTVKGAWANMPAHIMYYVCDAPNAHVVNQMAAELHLMDWNTVTVTPIETMEEATAAVQQRK